MIMVISLDSSGVQKLWIIHLMMDRMVSGYWHLYLSVIYTTLSRPELVIFTYETRINKFTEKLKLLISFLKSWAKEESEPRTGWVKNTRRTWSRSDPTDGPGFLGLVSTYGSTDTSESGCFSPSCGLFNTLLLQVTVIKGHMKTDERK